jgi:hypothetical protein
MGRRRATHGIRDCASSCKAHVTKPKIRDSSLLNVPRPAPVPKVGESDVGRMRRARIRHDPTCARGWKSPPRCSMRPPCADRRARDERLQRALHHDAMRTTLRDAGAQHRATTSSLAKASALELNARPASARSADDERGDIEVFLPGGCSFDLDAAHKCSESSSRRCPQTPTRIGEESASSEDVPSPPPSHARSLATAVPISPFARARAMVRQCTIRTSLGGRRWPMLG